MPSSALGSSPSWAMRRAISRALRPASTRTRVPLATSSTALPVEPLPSTEIFISENCTTEARLSGRLFSKLARPDAWAADANSDFQTRAIDFKAVQVSQRAQSQRRGRKACLGHALHILAADGLDRSDNFVG